MEAQNIDTVREYLAALEAGEAGDSLRRFFTDDALQTELPNLLNKEGQESDLEHLVQRSQQATKVLREQRYEIISGIAVGDRIAVEARWTGILAIPLGTLTPGSAMTASFAMFFLFRDGRIAVQRNYDCFDPW